MQCVLHSHELFVPARDLVLTNVSTPCLTKEAGRSHPACRQCLESGLHCRSLMPRGGSSVWRSTTQSGSDAASHSQENARHSTSGTLTFDSDNVSTEASPMTVANELTRPTSTPVPPTMTMAAFKDSVQASWLYNHYGHRPVLQDMLRASSNHSFGAAALSAATAMSSTMFSKFHHTPLGPNPSSSRPVEAPYCAEYASAVNALSLQIPDFRVSCLEEVLVPALLLMISEVGMLLKPSILPLIAHRNG